MANKKFTPEEIAILKANPYVMEVTEDDRSRAEAITDTASV